MQVTVERGKIHLSLCNHHTTVAVVPDGVLLVRLQLQVQTLRYQYDDEDAFQPVDHRVGLGQILRRTPDSGYEVGDGQIPARAPPQPNPAAGCFVESMFAAAHESQRTEREYPDGSQSTVLVDSPPSP